MTRTILICQGKTCGPRGSQGVLKALQQWWEGLSESDRSTTRVGGCDCLGHCEQGINMKYDDTVVNHVTVEELEERIDDGRRGQGVKAIDMEAVLKALDIDAL